MRKGSGGTANQGGGEKRTTSKGFRGFVKETSWREGWSGQMALGPGAAALDGAEPIKTIQQGLTGADAELGSLAWPLRAG